MPTLEEKPSFTHNISIKCEIIFFYKDDFGGFQLPKVRGNNWNQYVIFIV
jgi:hypothetical protein